MGQKLYVGNISYNTDDNALREVFSEDGRGVEDVHVVTDRFTGQSRGFAFVTMASDDDARAAMEALDGTQVDGRTIRVNEARERERGPGGPRGGGGGGYGGGGGRGGDRGGRGGGYGGGGRGGDRGGDRGGRY